MGQISIYLDKALEAETRAKAEAAGLSFSAYVASRLQGAVPNAVRPGNPFDDFLRAAAHLNLASPSEAAEMVREMRDSRNGE